VYLRKEEDAWVYSGLFKGWSNNMGAQLSMWLNQARGTHKTPLKALQGPRGTKFTKVIKVNIPYPGFKGRHW